VKINIFCEEVKSPKITKTLILDIAKTISKEENVVFADLNFIFCNDDYLLDINKQYLQHDYYTDIITFDYKNKKSVSSDIFISVDRVLDNSLSLNVSFERELQRIIIHGMLHLSGYEDNMAELRKAMSLKEDYYLDKIV
jgi:probable rRNA maturation factor